MVETSAFGRTIGRVVVRIDIDHVVGGIVVVFIAIFDRESLLRSAEIPVHSEVDDIQARVLREVGSVVRVAVEECIIGIRERGFAVVVAP